MCRRTLYALAFLICSVYADPRIIWLYNYDSGSTQNIVPVENGAKLHVASNDNVTLLQNIKIDAGLGAVSLDQVRSIADFKVSSNQLIITSTLDPPTSATLTGFIYVTTAAQANGSFEPIFQGKNWSKNKIFKNLNFYSKTPISDNTFSVTTVDDLKTLSITSGKSTSVVLNTQFTTTHIRPFNAPDKTTYVTNVQQFGSTSLNFHYGYPNDTVITTNQFFENPQYIDNYDDNGEVANKTRVFFAHVEPIQVNLPYWYITADGPFNIYLDNIYINLNIHNTTSVNTTGAFVLTGVWQNPFVNFMTDPTRGGTTGLLLTTDLESDATILFSRPQSNFDLNFGKTNRMVHGQLLTDAMFNTLQINSTALYPGAMYCQYFVFTGDLLPVTSSVATNPPNPQTTPPVITTTKLASNLNLSSFILLVSSFLCLML